MNTAPGDGWYAYFRHNEDAPHPYTTKHPIVVWTTSGDGRPQGWFSPDDAKTFGGVLLPAEGRSNFAYYGRDPDEEDRFASDLEKEEWAKTEKTVEVELTTGRTFVGRFDAGAIGPNGFVCFWIVETSSPDGDEEELWVRADTVVSIRVKQRFTAGSGQPVNITEPLPAGWPQPAEEVS